MAGEPGPRIVITGSDPREFVECEIWDVHIRCPQVTFRRCLIGDVRADNYEGSITFLSCNFSFVSRLRLVNSRNCRVQCQTPITVMRGFGKLLADKLKTQEPYLFSTYVTYLHPEGRQLSDHYGVSLAVALLLTKHGYLIPDIQDRGDILRWLKEQ